MRLLLTHSVILALLLQTEQSYFEYFSFGVNFERIIGAHVRYAFRLLQVLNERENSVTFFSGGLKNFVLFVKEVVTRFI